jgi:hypothetical protein
MTHKDAPPETPTQIACREWWQKAQPHVTRAWGRAKDGSYLAEESKLLHAAWVAAAVADRTMLLDLMQQFDTQFHQCPRCGWEDDCASMDMADELRTYLKESTP